MTVWALVIAVALLLANAFFVAIEFALVASRANRLEMMAAEGDRRAKMALTSVRDLQRQLAGAQLGITIASLGLGYVAEPAVAHLIEAAIEKFGEVPSNVLHPISFVVALALVVTLHMVLGEMVPKNIAIAGPETTARLLAPIHRAYVIALGPFISFLNIVSNAIVRLLGYEPVDELGTALTASEFHSLLANVHGEGLIEDAELELLSGALRLRERTVSSHMVPWDQVITVTRQATVSDIEKLVREHGHTRLPMVGSRGDVLGFVHSKDLLRLPPGDHSEPVPLEMVRRMLVVPPDRLLRDLMLAMRRQRLHMAVVQDKDRKILGMITLEDALERLVGDIRDESDRSSPHG